MLKPDVVFFGENVPRDRVEAAMRHLETADAMLIVGSSLMVYSGFRFVEAAARAGKPIAAVNLGRTRADDLLALKVEASCDEALAFLLGERRATKRASHPEHAEPRRLDRRVEAGGEGEAEHARVSLGAMTPSSHSRAVA